MAEDKAEEKDNWTEINAAVSYTSAFQIRQRMYRINDFDLPFRHGIAVEQFLAFVAALIVMFLVYNLIITPFFALVFGASIPFRFALLIILVPPVIAAQRVIQQMPSRKTLGGFVMSFIRYHLDDVWHRRGVPIPKEENPSRQVQGNYLRVWTVDPYFAGVEAPNDKPATYFANSANRPFPDHQIRAHDEEIERKESIMESEEEFYGRIRGQLAGDELTEHKRDDGTIFRATKKETTSQYDYLKALME